MGALYFGVGKSMGSLVGGLVIEELGVRNTFRIFGCLALVAASVYFLFTFIWERRRPEEDPEKHSAADTNLDSPGGERDSRKHSQLGNYSKGTFTFLAKQNIFHNTKLLAVPLKNFKYRGNPN